MSAHLIRNPKYEKAWLDERVPDETAFVELGIVGVWHRITVGLQHTYCGQARVPGKRHDMTACHPPESWRCWACEGVAAEIQSIAVGAKS